MSFLKEPVGSVRSLISKFKSSTTLAEPPAEPAVPAPDNVIDFMLHANRANHVDPDLVDIKDPYEHARVDYNKRAGGREAFEKSREAPENDTPVAQLTTLRGAIAAFWTGEKWKQAWASTGAVVGLTALNAQNAVWVTESMAKLVNTISHYQDPHVMNAAMGAAGVAGLYATGKLVGEAFSRRFRENLQRDWAFWMTDKFKKAAFEKPDVLYRVTHNQEDNSDAPDAMPDSPHQRIVSAPMRLTSSFMNITTRGLSTVLTGAFVVKALAENSVPVETLNHLGETLNRFVPNGIIDLSPGQAGTLLVAGAAVGTHLAISGPVGKRISKKIEAAYAKLDETAGKMTEKWVKAFGNSESIAASHGHKAMEEILYQAHLEVDQAIQAENKGFRKYLMFMDAQGFSQEVLSLIPALASFAGRHEGKAPVELFMTTRGLTSTLLSSVSYVIEVLPEYARLRNDGRRITEMAQMFEKARDKRAFYSLTGIHEFEEHTLDEDSGIAFALHDVELMHRGKDKAFLKATDIQINQGDWVLIRGESGTGKSSILKAVSGLWPYGRGTQYMRDDLSVFYAHQTPDLSGPYTLAEQVIYGMDLPADFAMTPEIKQRIAEALTEAGLGNYVGFMDEVGKGGKPWGAILSGGQKQRLVMARILFQRPDIILLDEPTSALDPKSKIDYLDRLKKSCPDSTVLIVSHDEQMQARGQHFNRQMTIEDGTAEITPPAYEEPKPVNLDAVMEPYGT